MVNKSAVSLAVKLLGRPHAALIVKLANRQDRLELEWMIATEALGKKIQKQIIDNLREGGDGMIQDKIILDFLFAHYLQVTGVAAQGAEEELGVVGAEARLARPKVPKSLREIREIYDRYRKTGKLPKGLKDMGKTIKDEYVKKTQSVWRKYSEDFREGSVANQESVLRKVEDAADVATSRAKTIVRTETTNYYNRTRCEIYDQSDAITHYLFLAIRDQRTSKWCTDKVVGGKRGRHGLVYAKNDSLTDKEKPACHWNCRSEMVPLSPFNPRHRALIEDLRMHRRNNTCHPLPKGWGNAS